MRNDRTGRGYFWIPRAALAAYSAFMALLFALGQHYSLVPWLLMGSILLGTLTIFIVARSLRAAPPTRPWFSTENEGETLWRRPGLGNFLIIILIGPAPFLLSAAIQEWLLVIAVPTGWLLAVSAAAVFIFIFGGYCLIEALLNCRAERMGLADS